MIGNKIQFIVSMLRVFIAHFSPVKFSKTIFGQKGQTPGFIKGDYSECQLYKMPLKRAWSIYLKNLLSATSELFPNLAWQMNHVLTFCIVFLVWVNVWQLI